MSADSCACRSIDAYECWLARYPVALSEVLDGHSFSSRNQHVRDEGGPCECVCHDAKDEDDFT